MLNHKAQAKLIKKIEGVEKKGSKLLRTLYVISVGMGAALAIYGVLVFNAWSFDHKIVLQNPIVLRTPLYIQSKPQLNAIKRVINPIQKVYAKEAGSSASLSEKDIIFSKEHGVILWKQYQLETQRGLTDYCRINKLGYGGFGVKDGNGIVCYPDFKTAVDRAEYWLVQNGVDTNTVKALCVWSNHLSEYEKTGTCSYYQNYLSL